jgi:predicted membrane metal-binding protein
VLILQPEAIVTPGFQMSFAATAALVALAEAWPPRTRELSVPWPIALFQSARHWLVVAVSASFVAGAATGPFAIQHFNRTAVFGLVANLATSPIADFIMMPALGRGAQWVTLALYGNNWPNIDIMSPLYYSTALIMAMLLLFAWKYGKLKHPATWLALMVNLFNLFLEPIGKSETVQHLLKAMIKG